MITNELFCPNEENRKVMVFFYGRFVRGLELLDTFEKRYLKKDLKNFNLFKKCKERLVF